MGIAVVPLFTLPTRMAGKRRWKLAGEAQACNDEINGMELALHELEVINSEVERLRQELSPKVKHMNEVMDGVKASYIEKKRTLKGYYPQERWAEYGIPDKR